jgi:hypothetical protein
MSKCAPAKNNFRFFAKSGSDRSNILDAQMKKSLQHQVIKPSMKLNDSFGRLGYCCIESVNALAAGEKRKIMESAR